MPLLPTISLKRLKAVSGITLAQFAPAASNMILSFVVINFFDAAWWGQLNGLQVYFMLALAAIAWGNKEYLLRAFSREPARLVALFRASLVARVPILLLAILCIPLASFNTTTGTHLAIWLLAGWFSQSVDVLVLYEKKFFLSLFTELFSFTAGLLFLLMQTGTATFETLLLTITCSQLLKALILLILFANVFRKHPDAPYQFKLEGLRKPLSFALLGFSGLLFTRGMLICAGHYLDDVSLAGFRVLFSFLVMVQAGSAFLFQPFAAGFYRMSDAGSRKLSRSLLMPGLLLSIAAALVLKPLMQLAFFTNMSWLAVTASVMFMFAAYVSLPSAYALFKNNLTKRVLLITLLGIISMVLAYKMLMRTFAPRIDTAVTAAALSQLCMSVLFIWAARNTRVSAPENNS